MHILQQLDLLQTINVGKKVQGAGLHSVLKMGPNQRIIKGANTDTNSSANDRLIISSIGIALGAASFQWMEGEKELSMRTTMSFNYVRDLCESARTSSGKG